MAILMGTMAASWLRRHWKSPPHRPTVRKTPRPPSRPMMQVRATEPPVRGKNPHRWWMFQDVPGAKCPFCFMPCTLFSTFSCSRLLLDLQSNWEIRILPWSFSAIYNIYMRRQWGATFLGDPVPLCILKTAQSWSGSINPLLLMYLLWIGECPDDLLLNDRSFWRISSFSPYLDLRLTSLWMGYPLSKYLTS